MKLAYPSRKYRDLVEFIALHDDPLDMDVKSIEGYTTVQMIRHCSNLKSEKVAQDVYNIRFQENKGE